MKNRPSAQSSGIPLVPKPVRPNTESPTAKPKPDPGAAQKPVRPNTESGTAKPKQVTGVSKAAAKPSQKAPLKQNNVKSVAPTRQVASDAPKKLPPKTESYTKRSKKRLGLGVKVAPPKKTRRLQWKVGQVCTLAIRALGPRRLGVVFFPGGARLFVQRAGLGEVVKARITHLNLGPTKRDALAKVVKTLRRAKQQPAIKNLLVKKPKVGKLVAGSTKAVRTKPSFVARKLPVYTGQVLTVTIQKMGPRGCAFASWKGRYAVVIPAAMVDTNVTLGAPVQVRITCIKAAYAVGQPLCASMTSTHNRLATSPGLVAATNFPLVAAGTRLTLRLPSRAKRRGNRVVVQMQPSGYILFVRWPKRTGLSQVVRVQLDRVYGGFALASPVEINPIPHAQKVERVRQTLRRMVQARMHWGEKAVRADARMSKYLWRRVSNSLTRQTSNPAATKRRFVGPSAMGPSAMGPQTEGLLQKGRLWLKKGRHALNLLRTYRCLNRVLTQVGRYAATGRRFLFVGTQKSAATLVARAAGLSRTAFYVNTRWLGGMLTNWRTLVKSIAKIRPIWTRQRVIVRAVLRRRQTIYQALLQRIRTYAYHRDTLRPVFEQGRMLLDRWKKPNDPHWTRTQFGWELGQRLMETNRQLARMRRRLRQAQTLLLQQQSKLRTQSLQLKRTHEQIVQQLTAKTEAFNQCRALLRLSVALNGLIQTSPTWALKPTEMPQTKGLPIKDVSTTPTTFQVVAKRRFVAANLQQNEEALWQQTESLWNRLPATVGSAGLPLPPKFLSGRVVQWMRQTVRLWPAGSGVTLALGSKQKPVSQARLFAPWMRSLHDFGTQAESILTQLQLDLQTLERQAQSVQKDWQEVASRWHQMQSRQQTLRLATQAVERAMKHVHARFRPWKAGCRRWMAEKRLWKFVQKMKHITTPAATMRAVLPALMYQLVDPKLKDRIARYDVHSFMMPEASKKVAAARKKRWQQLERYLGGVVRMHRWKPAQLKRLVVVIVGQSHEMNAVRECARLGIPTIQLVDTDAQPGLADHVVPMNDEAKSALQYALRRIVQRIRLGRVLRRALTKRSSAKKARALRARVQRINSDRMNRRRSSAQSKAVPTRKRSVII